MTRNRHTRRLSLEALEARLNPVTFVLANFSAGALIITGNDNPESVEVTQGADDRLTLAVLGGGQIRLNGGPGLTAVTLPAPVTAGAAFHLGGGADTLFLTGVDLPGPVTIDGGTGGNRVVLQGGVTVRGNLAISNGTGFDRTTLTGPVTVAGNLTIAHGAGGSLVDDDPSTELQVTGALTVTNGPGADTVNLGNAARIAVGRLRVNHGPGPETNRTTLAPTVVLTVGTTVRVTGGAGLDFVTLGGGRVSVGGGVTIAAGARDSFTNLDPTGGLFVGGTVAVTAATGHDTVRIGRTGGATAIGGGVRVSIGDGASDTVITGSPLTIGGAVRVTGTAGADTAEVYSAAGDGAVGGGVTFDLGTGRSQNAVVGAIAGGTALSVGGALRVTTAGDAPVSGFDRINLTGVRVRLGTTVTTGAGGDTVDVDDCTFDGAFALATGAGSDTVRIERQGYAGTTRFRGPVRVATGAGPGFVEVGFNNPGTDQAVFGSTSTWDGGPETNDIITIVGTGNIFIGPLPVITGFETSS